MTGFADEDPSKRNRDVAAGRTPGAILNPKTNTWHQVSAFTPLGSLLAIGATLAREQNQPLKDESKRAEKIAGAVTQTIAQQPLLTGAKDISEAITQPGKTGERAGRIAGSFVPTIVSDIGELTDSTRREGRGFTGQIQRRIPIARKRLPPAFDALGRPLEDRRTAFFDPTLTSSARDKTNPLERELVRLDMGLSRLERKTGEPETRYRERQGQFDRTFAKLADEMVRSSDYKGVDDETKRAAFDALRRFLHGKNDHGKNEPDTQTIEDVISRAKIAVAMRRQRQTK